MMWLIEKLKRSQRATYWLHPASAWVTGFHFGSQFIPPLGKGVGRDMNDHLSYIL